MEKVWEHSECRLILHLVATKWWAPQITSHLAIILPLTLGEAPWYSHTPPP